MGIVLKNLKVVQIQDNAGRLQIRFLPCGILLTDRANRYTSKEVFEQIAAIPSNDLAWMQQELQWFWDTPEEQACRQQYWAMVEQYENVSTDLDFGDYTTLSGLFAPMLPFAGAITRDDYGNWYFGVSVGSGTPGVSLTRKDIFINGTDIDQMGLSAD